MSWKLSRYRAGDWVEVRSKEEILQTLDERSCTAGIPLMPEMLKYCGQRFQVEAVAHKTCDWVIHRSTMRRVSGTVHLANLRCDGSAHGGCQAECNLFWRDEWLKPADGKATRTTRPSAGATGSCTEENVLRCTRQPAADGEVRYACQATHISAATEPLPSWDLRQYLYDVTTRNHPPGLVFRVLFLASLRWLLTRIPFGFRAFKKFHDHMHVRLAGRSPPELHGRIADGSPTPSGRLDLQSGEYVRIKSQQEIEQTIDRKWKNRGLSFDPEEMAPYCNRVARVHKSVTRIIDEQSGKMLDMKQPCIMLEGIFCRGHFATGRLNCPRAITSYWREIWLERAEPPAAAVDKEPAR